MNTLEDVWDFLKFLAPIVVAFVLVFGGIVGLVVWGNDRTCDRLARLMPEHRFDFDFFGGCFVQLDSGRWVSTDDIAYIEGDLKVAP